MPRLIRTLSHPRTWHTDGTLLLITIPPGVGSGGKIGLDPNYRRPAHSGSTGSIDLYRATTGERVHSLPQPHWVQRFSFSPDGDLLAVATHANKVLLWRLP